MIGLLGKKIGMTQVFDQQGQPTAVTVIQAGPCQVVRVHDNNGRKRVQIGYGESKAKHLTKPELGHLKQAGIETPLRHLREFPLGEKEEYTPGQQLTVAMFEPDEFVDVTGISIGKGFQGGMKRWGWKGGGASHGSMSHRRPGSIGSNTTPGRVFRGHHLPGHMGVERVTVQNLRVMRVQPEAHLLAVKGAVPGPSGSLVLVRKALKRKEKWNPPPPQASKDKAKTLKKEAAGKKAAAAPKT